MHSSLLYFNPEAHSYSYMGIHIPGFSELMRATGITQDVSRFAQGALKRGTAVHKATEDYDKGNDTTKKLPIEYRPFFEAYKQFRSEHRVELGLTESKVLNTELFYAGTLDRLWIVDGVPTLTDIKTGQPYPWHPIQLTGYKLALGEMSLGEDHRVIEKRDVVLSSLYLTKDGTYRFHPWAKAQEEESTEIVQSMSRCYWFGRKKDYRTLKEF